MPQMTKTLLGFGVAVALVLGAGPASAQTITTGTLTGVVMDAQKAVLPGATVVAVHEPTGTTYETVTQSDGRFTMLAVRAGGPYTVKASMSSFKTQEQGSVMVALGESRSVDFTLPLESMQETVDVVALAQVIDTTRAGTADNVGSETLQALPSVSRNLFDFARTSPYFNAMSSNADDTFISVAGRNNRYNNVQIDGAVNNDLFGLAANGAPGGQAGTQPISLDAIQELQLVVSPYDVRQGVFSGGGVNAITKTGTNSFKGTGYFYYRNQDWVGVGPANTKIATFKDKQFGGSVGGPIAKNKAFFFTNLDYGRRSTPSGFSADGSSGQNFGHAAEIQQVLDIMKNVYGYDPGGGLKEYIRDQNNNKFFVRSDMNLSKSHRLTARYNYVQGNQWVGTHSTSTYKLWDNFYNFISETNSVVGQLNSTLGSTSFNEFRVSYQRIRDHRETPGQLFPQVTIRFVDGVTRVNGGSEQFSVANVLDQDIVEINDDFTKVKGTHTFTIGTHNEFFKFRNLFIRDNAGTYQFSSIANFAAGIAGSYDYSYSVTADPKQAARFKIQQLGFYAGDQWRIKPRFTLTYGIRYDNPAFPDKPTANPAAEAVFGYGTDVVPSSPSWSPRAGFNYDLGGSKRQQIRGGVGLFAGRTPYVWLSNQYGNTGIEFRRLSVTYSAANSIAFVPDPAKQPTSVGSAATNEVDMVDPDYKFPSLIRGNLAYDRELFWGMKGTFEYLFSRVVKDIKYQNLNYIPSGATRPDGRIALTRKDTAYSDVIFLTNTDQGNSSTFSVKIDKPWKKGWFASGSYAYGMSKSIMDGTSSQAASNWGNVYVPGDVNNPPLARSNFDMAHRITLQASYDIPVYKGVRVNAAVYYNGQSGRPYVDLFSGDVNGDGRTTNDLMYVPRDANDVVVVYNGVWDTLETYLRASGLDAYRGQIVSRNIFRSPWINGMDVKFNIQLPTGRRVRTEVTFDILNFLNLFNRNNGTVLYANFNDLLPLGYGGLDFATGKMRYNIQNLTNLVNNGQPVSPDSLYTRDDLRSRWQAQLGLRVRF